MACVHDPARRFSNVEGHAKLAFWIPRMGQCSRMSPEKVGRPRFQSAIGSQMSSATSITRSGSDWFGSVGARTSPTQTQTTSLRRR
jgi:hypothetical protein